MEYEYKLPILFINVTSNLKLTETMSSSLFSHLKIIMWLRACAMRVNELVCGYSKSYQTPSLSCRTGCGHIRLLVNVARNDISELGFNQTLISRVPVNYLWLYDRMSLYLFLCYTQGNFLVNRNKWRIVCSDGYNCLPDCWVTQVRILHFPAPLFVSLHVYVQVSLNARICQHC